MKKLSATVGCLALFMGASAQSFTAGNIVVLQTSGTVSKASSAVTLKEFTTTGTAGTSVTLPVTGPTPFQSAGIYGGSEGFLSTSADGKYLVLGGYGTSGTYTDITGTASSSVLRVVGTVAPSGFYMQVASSNSFFSGNDIRGAISDSTHFWASGASVASADGINYFGPGTPAALAGGTTPPKAYGLRIFNGQIYYSTQKSGPTSSGSQLGIFALGTGMPTSGTVTVSQVINTGSNTPEDFSFNAAGDVCYVAINMNTAAGGIQKWTKSGTTWSLAYTLGTGVTNIGAYGLIADYSGTNPVIYATTFESTGNRVIKITDNGTLASATITTLVAAASNVYYKGIAFAPVASGKPVVNISVSTDTASEAGKTAITVTANATTTVASAQTLSLGVSGAGITSGDYTLSSGTITIPSGSSSGSVTFTVNDDILGEGTEIVTLTLSSPSSGIVLGTQPSWNITIADNDGNNFPTIMLDTATTNYIDAGVTAAVATPFKMSAVLGDPTDPGMLQGLVFAVNDLETIDTSLTLNVVSSDTSIVKPSGLVLSGKGGARTLKITPVQIGHTDITLTVSDGIDSTQYVVNYAASAAAKDPAATYWHTGMSDASDAMALDNNYFISGDDELNILNVYSRNHSGMPLVSYNYTSFLSLPDPGKPEVDLEAATPSPVNANRYYWLGSMSNGKSPFDNKPNRDRIFANTVTGTGAATAFSFVGYAALRTAIIGWGDANGYNFTASAAAGVDSKTAAGFSAEGMVFGPDSTTLYIGLRTPLVPVTARKKALIVPVKNFETWFNNGAPSGTPAFAAPIELNLGGLGIRDMIRLSNGTYVIVAGNVDGSKPTHNALYKWSGKTTDTAVMVSSPASDTLNMEGVMPVFGAGGALSLSSLQVVSDMGDEVLYNDGTAAKDFNDLVYRKFRSDMLNTLDLTMPTTSISGPLVNKEPLKVYPNPASTMVAVQFYAAAASQYELNIADMAGKTVYHAAAQANAGANSVTANLSGLAKGLYVIRIVAGSVSYNQKLVVE
jgi:hypothetical protein